MKSKEYLDCISEHRGVWAYLSAHGSSPIPRTALRFKHRKFDFCRRFTRSKTLKEEDAAALCSSDYCQDFFNTLQQLSPVCQFGPHVEALREVVRQVSVTQPSQVYGFPDSSRLRSSL